MGHTKRWFKARWILWQAGQWARAGGAPVAARCMFELNRRARVMPEPTARTTYALKNRMVRALYEAGYCRAVGMQTQRQECRGCSGSGIDWYGGECDRCGGTGTWREHKLYLFTFRVGGRYYRWHQPEGMVGWPVALTGDLSEYTNGRGNYRALSQDIWALYGATVYAWLRHQGVPAGDLPRMPGLRQALAADWREWQANWLGELARRML